MINVTKTFLPPQAEYNAVLKRAWDNNWITNRGELARELEEKLKSSLNVSNILLMTNGTLPLQIAIKALDLKGEIITTPFSYVATTSSIVWENCKPIFVDIHPDFLTIDESKIEDAITEKTSAILATHVFGNPCNIEVIERIAKKYDLKVIYDAAHCFDINYNGKSIFTYGDISTCSFHATKLFHTGEGGAIFTNDKELHDKIFYHHNFGHHGKENFSGLGINAKISELQAAMGIAVLPYMTEIKFQRKRVVDIYKKHLVGVGFMEVRENTDWNYSYFPVIFNSEEELLRVMKVLNENSIFPRRYFYPSLDTLPYINSPLCDISNSIASRIVCLPLYHDLNDSDVVKISGIINENV